MLNMNQKVLHELGLYKMTGEDGINDNLTMYEAIEGMRPEHAPVPKNEEYLDLLTNPKFKNIRDYVYLSTGWEPFKVINREKMKIVDISAVRFIDPTDIMNAALLPGNKTEEHMAKAQIDYKLEKDRIDLELEAYNDWTQRKGLPRKYLTGFMDVEEALKLYDEDKTHFEHMINRALATNTGRNAELVYWMTPWDFYYGDQPTKLEAYKTEVMTRIYRDIDHPSVRFKELVNDRYKNMDEDDTPDLILKQAPAMIDIYRGINEHKDLADSNLWTTNRTMAEIDAKRGYVEKPRVAMKQAKREDILHFYGLDSGYVILDMDSRYDISYIKLEGEY